MSAFLRYVLLASASLVALAGPANADDFHFSTGTPDGLIGTASRPGGSGTIEIETADDFVLAQDTQILSGTFTGLLPANTDSTNVGQVVLEIYRVFPLDSTNPPSTNVPTRVNSPSDVAFDSRDSSAGELSVTITTVAPSFTVLNSVVNGINPSPSQFTGGEGPITGVEALFSFSLSTPFDLPAGHYFFVPQVQLANGTFLWLSAPRPITGAGTPFPAGSTDLQSWIRNENLAPDWLRIGTDITHQGPFNAAFSLDGLIAAPEPASWMLMLTGFGAIGVALRRSRRRIGAAVA